MKETTQIHIDLLKTIGIEPDPERPFVWKVGDMFVTATQLASMMECQVEREAELKAQLGDNHENQ